VRSNVPSRRRRWLTHFRHCGAVPCTLETSAPNCYTVGGGFTIYGEPDGSDLSWVESVAYTVTETAMTDGILNGASPEIQQVRYVGAGAFRTMAPTSVSPTTVSPSMAPFTMPPSASPTTKAPTGSPTTVTPSAAPLTTASPSQSPTTSSPTIAPSATPSQAPSPAPSPVPSQAPSLPNRQVKAAADNDGRSRIFPWWYIVAAGGSLLLVVSGGSLWYAKRKRRRRRMSNDSDQIGGFPTLQPSMT
jgi:hypothetical protein